LLFLKKISVQRGDEHRLAAQIQFDVVSDSVVAVDGERWKIGSSGLSTNAR